MLSHVSQDPLVKYLPSTQESQDWLTKQVLQSELQALIHTVGEEHVPHKALLQLIQEPLDK